MSTNPEAMRASVSDIGPDEAQRLLDRNTRNRRLRKRAVGGLAAAMERGEWVLNGEAIKVAIDGTLLDGQHRLQAVVQSGVTIRTLVIRGLEPEAQESMDMGTRRSAGDVAFLREIPNGNAVVAAARLRLTYDAEGTLNAPRVPHSHAAIVNEVEANLDAYGDAVRLAGRISPALPPRGHISALATMFGTVDVGERDEFFRLMHTGEGLRSGMPEMALRNWIINSLGSTRRPHAAFGAAVWVYAWNARIESRALKIVKWNPSWGFPEITGYERRVPGA